MKRQTTEIEFNENFREFIELLNSKKVRYLLVGGFAVGLHGYPRYTGDLDIWIEPELQNGEKMVEVLNDFGFGSLKCKAEDFIKIDFVHQFGNVPIRIDVLTGVSGLDFNESYKQKKRMKLGGVWINVVHLNDLKKNKLQSGRPEDISDVIKLEKIEHNAKKHKK